MANKKTVAVTEKEYEAFLKLFENGYESKEGKKIRANRRMAAIIILQGNLGLRIGDILDLKLSDFIKDGERWRLDITEQKTGKVRIFTVPVEILDFIRLYAKTNDIKENDILFPITTRAVQKQLKEASDYLGIPGISTHSFRKYFATSIYLDNGYNIELVRTLLQHSSTAITQRYIGIQTKEIEYALKKHIKFIQNNKN